MTSIHQLTAGDTHCIIRADMGACIAGLWHAGHAVLRSPSPESLATSRQSGCYPLVPYSNRIGNAVLHWQDEEHRLPANNPPEPHAIHGVGWQRAWDIVDSSPAHLTLSHTHRDDPSWPFAYRAEQRFGLADGKLEVQMTLTSDDSRPAPAGLGWHPYFIKRPGSHLRFAASGRWEMGADKLPTQRRNVTGIDAGCASLDVDHCFDGWPGEAVLSDEVLVTRIRSDLSRLVVFTNGTRDFIAIEPVSHVNNAFDKANADELGVRTLAPGESIQAYMTLLMSLTSPT